MTEIRIDDDGEGHPKVSRKDKDGAWREETRKPISDDPEVEAMGKLSFAERRRIKDDADDPRHEAAREYDRLLGKRLSSSVLPAVAGLTNTISEVQTNVASKLGSSASTSFLEPVVGNFRDPIELPEIPEVHDPTLDVVEAQNKLIEHMSETNEVLALLLEQSRTDAAEQKTLLEQQIADAREAAEEQKSQADREHERGDKALKAAWTAVAVTVVVGVFQIGVGIAQLALA